MKITKTLFVLIVIIAAIFTSCNRDTKQSQSGAFDGIIKAQVENGDIFNSKIKTLHLIRGMNNLFTNFNSYANSGFTYNLFDTDDDYNWWLEDMSIFPDHYNISDRTTRYMEFSEIYGSDDKGARVVKFQLILSENEFEKIYVSFWYVERDVTFNGMTLKEGWNKIQTKENKESGNTELSIAQFGTDVKWKFEEMYFYEEPNDPFYKLSQNNELIDFITTFVNSDGNSIQLKPNDTYVMQNSSGSLENEITGGFELIGDYINGDYFYWGHPAGDFGIYLVPAGVDLIMHGSVLPSDKTKIRLITEDMHSDPVVYYRNGELPPQH